MYKYGGALANMFAIKFSAIKLEQMHNQLMNDSLKGDFKLLELLHHMSSGQKAVYTKITSEDLNMIRESCGGAGFSAFSGLPDIQKNNAPNPTFEGDNTVLLQ